MRTSWASLLLIIKVCVCVCVCVCVFVCVCVCEICLAYKQVYLSIYLSIDYIYIALLNFSFLIFNIQNNIIVIFNNLSHHNMITDKYLYIDQTYKDSL